MYCRHVLLLADTTLYRQANMGLQEVLLPLCPILLRSRLLQLGGKPYSPSSYNPVIVVCNQAED